MLSNKFPAPPRRAPRPIEMETICRMERSTGPRLAVLLPVTVFVATVFPFGPARCEAGMEISMSEGSRPASEVPQFAPTDDAEAFVARYLPVATAADPRYRPKDGGVETRWITKSVRFDRDKATNRILVSMNEAILEYSDGALSAEGTHEAAFFLDEVQVSERRDAPDVTSAGEPAIGVIFNCKSGKCIRSVYMGAKSSNDWTDVYIQDKASRAAILAAFTALLHAAPKP